MRWGGGKYGLILASGEVLGDCFGDGGLFSHAEDACHDVVRFCVDGWLFSFC